MKILLILLLTFITQLSQAQSDTAYYEVNPFSNHQVSLNMNFISSNQAVGNFDINYRKLLQPKFTGDPLAGTMKEGIYRSYGISITFLPQYVPVFDENELISIQSNSIIQLWKGNTYSSQAVMIGREVQNRLFDASNRGSGIQFVRAAHIFVGSAQKLEQYFYQTAGVGSSNNSVYHYSTLSDIPIQGERLSNYLQIGGKISFGGDLVLTYSSKCKLTLGLRGTASMCGQMLINENIRKDASEIYVNDIKRLVPVAQSHISARIGLNFK